MISCLFLIGDLGGGGAERVLVNLVNNLDPNEYDITVETMFRGGVNVQQLSPHVKYYCRKAPSLKGIMFFIRFFTERFLYRYFIGNAKYDLIIAFMHGVPVKVVAGCTDNNPVLMAWLHNGNPETGSFFRSWFSKKKAFKAYARMDKIVGVSDSVASAFSAYTKIGRDKVVAKYNANDTDKIIRMSETPFSFDFSDELPVVCSVGKLAKVKGYDRLIKAAVRLHGEGFLFYLAIIGNGPEKESLTQMIKDSGSEEYIKLLGFQDNPYKIMKKSDLFVSSSRSEGLATVLTEALTLGLPVVSTDVSGAKEVLGSDNEYGLIVDNSEEGIYKGIKLLLQDQDLQKKYIDRARERAQAFDTKHTVGAVDSLFREVLSKDLQ